jgi:hypothetical protein
MQPSNRRRYGGSQPAPHTAIVYQHVAERLGPRCTAKGVEHKVARAVLLLEITIEEAHRTGNFAQCDEIFARLNAHRHTHATSRDNALRRHAIADSTEQVERCAWQEATNAAAARREIDALADEIAAAEVLMVQMEGAK